MKRLYLLLALTLFGCDREHTFSAPNEKTVTAEDMPRIPSTSLQAALKTFQQARKFRLELVAGEPMVSDPVDACFDEFGRMYVAEMHGYPFSQEPTKLNPKGGGKKDAGIIRLLEDTDGDGKMDKSTVFADKLRWPTSIRFYNGGVFVLAPSQLLYLKDTDKDGKADTREVVLSGFGRDNVQAVANGLEWGLDNKITFSAGRNPKRLLHRSKPLFAVGGNDLRFDPKTEKFELATGGLQFGHSMDEWGTRFVCSNSNHIQQVIFEQRYLARNPYLVPPSTIRSIAVDGASARVFRISPPEPWRIVRQKWRALDKGYRLIFDKKGGWQFIPLDPSKKKGAVPTEYPVGFFTSATGITIYRGDAYPAAFRGNAFVGDVGGNLVHRKTLNRDRVVYRAERADAKTEFLRSTDNWFRPVNFVNAPDGTLYVLDMYRETIEHPHSIPVEIKKFLDLQSGSDRGRIYRLVSPGWKRKRPPILGKMTSAELVEHLSSGNGYVRQTAQRLLWERGDKKVVPHLEKLLQSTKNPFAVMHALYVLDGLGSLTDNHLMWGIANKEPRVRAHAVRLSEPLLANKARLLREVLTLYDDESEHVRFQVALSLGEYPSQQTLAGLARIAADPRTGSEVRTAVLSSVGTTSAYLASLLLEDEKFLKQKNAASMLTELARITGSNPKTVEGLRILEAAVGESVPSRLRAVVLKGLGEGLARRGTTLSKLFANRRSATLRDQAKKIIEQAVSVAKNEKLALAERESALRLIGVGDFQMVEANLPAFLDPRMPQPLQKAAVETLGQHPVANVPELLLSRWRTFSPQIRRAGVDALLTRPEHTEALLAALKNKKVKPSDIDRDKKQLLMNHRNEDIRARARKLLNEGVVSDRAKVVKAYQDVLELTADKSRGQKVFEMKCAVCHQVGKVGHKVAPELASVKNKSESDLLLAILDPNREAQPNFEVYSVETKDGRILTGMIESESANSITLLRAEAKRDVILRSNIEELFSTGLSLMPEGLEKDLSKQNLADVIAFVKSIEAKK